MLSKQSIQVLLRRQAAAASGSVSSSSPSVVALRRLQRLQQHQQQQFSCVSSSSLLAGVTESHTRSAAESSTRRNFTSIAAASCTTTTPPTLLPVGHRWFSDDGESKDDAPTPPPPAGETKEGEESSTPPANDNTTTKAVAWEKRKGRRWRDIPDKYETPDDCPPWQNSLHHGDPDAEKILIEDFGPDEEIEYVEAPPLADPNNPDKILASQEIYDLADDIVHLSMLELKDLIDKIAYHFDFEDPPFTGPGLGGGDGAGGDEEEGEGEAAAEKTAFDLKLVGFDAKSKIKVIKEVRAVAGLGLKEAKEMVEGAPKVVMKDINKEMAEELKEKLEAVGAEVEIV